MSTLVGIWMMARVVYPELARAVIGLLQSSGIVVVAAMVALLLHRQSAVARSWVWRAGFVALFFAALWISFPRLLKEMRPAVKISSAPVPVPHEVEHELLRAASTRPALSDDFKLNYALYESHRDPSAAQPPLPQLRATQSEVTNMWVRGPELAERRIFTLWWAGAVLLAGWKFARAMLGLRWLRRVATPIREAQREVVRRVAVEQGVSIPVACWLADGITSPLLTGWLKPVVWLPEESVAWSSSKLRLVLKHELAHHRRRDALWQSFAMAVTCFWWWNPAAWLARRRLLAEAELAADELVVAQPAGAPDYAEALVEVARASARPKLPSAGVPMLRKSWVETRVRAILANNPRRGRLGWAGRTLAVAVAALGVLACALVINPQNARALDERSPTSGPKETLSAEQVQLVKRALDGLTQRHQQMHYLHYQLEESITQEEPETKKMLTSKTAKKLEAWTDQWTGQCRAEFKPDVTIWTNGAAPFCVNNETLVEDGKHSYRMDSDRDVMESAPYPQRLAEYLGLTTEYEAMRLLQAVLSAKTASVGPWHIEVMETKWQNRPVFQVQQIEGTDPKQQLITSYVLDPAQGFALLHYEFVAPQNKMEWTQWESASTAGGLFYPKRYERQFRDKSTYRTEVKLFESVERLPEKIFAPPQTGKEKWVSTKEKVQQPAAMEVKLVDAAINAPLAGAKVRWHANSAKEEVLTSDERGVVTVPLPKETIKLLRFRASKEGFVRQDVKWSVYGDPLQLPATYTIQLYPASRIFGKVTGEDGKPVAGATVDVSDPGSVASWSVFTDHHDIYDVKVKTKADGTWEMPGFPPDLDGLVMRVSHPDFLATTDLGYSSYRHVSGMDFPSLRDGTSVVILKAGVALSGTVQDTAGQPVAGCHLSLGQDRNGANLPEVVSKADGAFVFKSVKEGTHWLTAESSKHKLFATSVTVPKAREKKALDPMVIVLQPGLTLRARVVKEDGSPSAGLFLEADKWKGLRTAQFSATTDKDGRFTWNGAPDEPVEFYLGVGQGREFLGGLPLTAGDKEQVVVMRPALRVRGTVVDGNTGLAVKEFRVIPGRWWRDSSPVWNKDSAKTFRDGAFEWSTTYMIEQKYFFTIEADGYEPLITDPMPSRQQTETLTVKLKPKA